MPLIPQYRAQGPAGPERPRMEPRQQGPRVSAQEAVQGIARLGGVLDQGGETPNVDPNLGQAEMAGLEQVGAGIQNVGDALYDVRMRVLEAKNYDDEHKAQIAMDREVLEFEKWKAEEPNPEEWEPKWRERMERFGGNYFANKNISPAAETAIRQRMESFTEGRAIRVGMDAMRQTVGNATDALMADAIRAKEEGNLELYTNTIDDGVKRGWIPVDTAESMKIRGKDEIEAKEIADTSNTIDGLLEYGDTQGALEILESSPLTESEKFKMRAHIENRHAINSTTQEIRDEMYSETGPDGVLRKLASGEWSEIKGERRAQLEQMAAQMKGAETVAIVKELQEDISLGALRTPTDLSGDERFRTLSDRDKLRLEEYFKNGAQNDIAEFSTMLRAVRAYDPANDPRGQERTELETQIALGFSGDRAQELAQTLFERFENPEPLKPTQRVVSDFFSSLQGRMEEGAFGDFRVSADRIKKREGEAGETFYEVMEGEKKFLGFFGPAGTPRTIELSEADRIAIEEGNTNGKTFIDTKAKEAAYSRFLRAQEEIERRMEAGELTTAEEMEKAALDLMGLTGENILRSEIQKDAIGNELPGSSFGTINAGLFPSAKLETEIDSLLDATGY